MVARVLTRIARVYLAAVIVVTLLAVVAAVGAVARPQTFWTTDGRALAHSLDAASRKITAPDRCIRTAEDDTWLCPVEDDPGSGPSGEFRLQMRSDRCWTAVRMERHRRRKTLRGCVGLLDYIGFDPLAATAAGYTPRA